MRRAFTIIESLVTLAALFVLTMLLLSLIKFRTAPPKPAPTAKMENAKTAPLPGLPVVRETAKSQP
jgi:hypothetical protein